MNTFKSVVLAMLFTITGVMNIQAEIIFNSVSSTPAGYVSGETISIQIDLDFSTPDFEFADYVVFNLPANWTAILTPGAANPTDLFGCDVIVSSGEGTNQIIFGLDDPAGMPTSGSNCGAFPGGLVSYYLDISVPGTETGPMNVAIEIYGDGFSANPTLYQSQNLALAQIACVITCPSDIVMTNDAGECGAMVTIDLPVATGTCNPDATDQSGFFPVGTTEVFFSANASGAGGEMTCSMFVTVLDEENPTLTVPTNQSVTLGGGECSEIFNFVVAAEDACVTTQTFLTQSNDNTFVDNSFACPGGDNSYFRVFDMAALGYFTNVDITSIELGVFQTINNPNVTVKIHELDGALTFSNLTLVSENTLTLPNLFLEIYDFPILATLEADKQYVIEVITPGSLFNSFVMGTNGAGETAPSYISSAFCGIPTIETMTNAGANNQSLVITLNGTIEGVSIEQTAGLPAGSEYPIGTTTNTYVATDASGNTSESSFDITVEEFPNPITTLACNNLVNVSLDSNCEGLITPDMVLEGGPYGCYDNYTITIKDEAGNEYGNIVTGDLVGLQLIVEVEDPTGNICWGEVLIEDKLEPELECSTRTTQCTESTDPLASLASVMRLTRELNTTISNGAPASYEIEFEVEGLNGASITDLNIDLDIAHTWVSDLAFELISPEGTSVALAIQPGNQGGFGCPGNDLQVTFDDEATLTNLDLENTCEDQVPTISGEFQSLGTLAAFDGEDPNGIWVLRVNDFANGDGGTVRSIVLEISQTGGAIGLPIPEDAVATKISANSFFVVGLDPCGPAILTYEDDVNNMDCTSPFTQVIYRTYTATDESGNEAVSCTDTINVLRTDLGSLEFPPNYDDLDQSAISCTSGYPTPAVTGSPTGAFCENVQMDYEDITIDICEGSYKVLRYWTILEWCESEIIEYVQIIKVVDNQGPSISCPTISEPISTSPSTCTASLLLPVPVISDNCSAFPTYTVSASSGILGTQGSNYSLENLEIGITTVTYIATDNCGNSSSCSFDIEVEDNISPVAVCDQHTTVSLSFDDLVTVNALTFDDGSYDECSDITMAARRMTDDCSFSGNTQFGSSVVFCCADVGNTIMVEFRVEDASGNYNTCMVEVEVDDKIAPAIEVPGNVTLSCQDDYTDFSLTGGMAIGYDNCEVDMVTFVDFPSIGSCGSGQVTRQFTVKDKSGLTAVGTQIIFLIDNDPFDSNDINFPSNKTLTSCSASTDPSATGVPITQDDICSQVSYTYWDDKFIIVEDACEIIYRKWTVIDQCQYNANTGVGIWEDIQVIEITNNTPPEFTGSCPDITIDGFGVCEGPATLSVEATDDCTPENKLSYSWKIDLDNTNDGIFELENTGKTVTSTFAFGTHRIVWTVADKCGNIDVCSYLFTVRDAKAPTPYCISSLSTAVMNNNGTVVIWASDFNLGATDNCTPEELLIPSFSEFGITSSRSFSCDDIPNGIAALIDDIQIWVTDEAGNKDFCTVSLLVEDNEADFCDDVGTITATGALLTANDEVIVNVDIEAKNQIEDVAFANTGASGSYSFDLIPNFEYEIRADKNDNILNGITTLDIILIQKHILGIQTFNSPYKTIAADTDNNGNVTGADIIAVRRLILGFTDLYPNDQKSWRFVDKKEVFNNVYEVFPYDEVVNVSFTTGSGLNNDFVGVKIGDVNNSAAPAEFTGNADTRDAEVLEFVIDDMKFAAGQQLDIPIYASNVAEVIAYQMTMEYDANLLNIKSVRAGSLDITEDHFNMTRLSEGLFSTLFHDMNIRDNSEALFYITAEALHAGNLANAFRISDRITESVAYDNAQNDMGISINVRDDNGMVNTVSEFILYSNTPNPFTSTTNIAFELPKATDVQIKIYDTNGVLVKMIQQPSPSGFNSIEVNRDELQASGVYYYTIIAGDKSTSGKMILID